MSLVGIPRTLVIAAAALWLPSTALAQLQVSVMPSNSQNTSYGNAAINQPIQVWGRAWGGTAPYTYTLTFGDGTPDAGGAVVNPNDIGTAHTFTTAGTKSFTLTVSDSAGATANRSGSIRVYSAPTQDQRVSMAIEKALRYLYLNQNASGADQCFWQGNSSLSRDYLTIGATAAAILSFEENGHRPGKDPVEYIYAPTVKKGLDWLTHVAGNHPITSQTYGNPDTNGNGVGTYLSTSGHDTYVNAFAALALIASEPTAAGAQARTIPTGPLAGKSYYQTVQDIIDLFNYSQSDGANYGSWQYGLLTANSGPLDGSAMQWPALVSRTAKDLWGIATPSWVIDRNAAGFKALQNAAGGIGYSANNSWVNSAKTGGALTAWELAGLTPDNDTAVAKGVDFIEANYHANTSGTSESEGSFGQWYGMWGMKKGLQLQGVSTLQTPTGARDWQADYDSWLLGEAAGLAPTTATSYRNVNSMFGQRADGSWLSTNQWPGSSISDPDIATAHAVLILTRSVTVALPVAVIAEVNEVSTKPGQRPFQMDGTASFHSDPTLSIQEYRWDFDASNGVDFDNPDATGAVVTNPGYTATGNYTISLQVRDNSDPQRVGQTTEQVVAVDTDVAPTGIAIPAGKSSYNAKPGDLVTFDGSASFDPDGDSISLYEWDLDGDGQFDDATGETPQIVAGTSAVAAIRLRVTALGKTGVSAEVPFIVSLNDLSVVNLTASDINSGASADITVMIGNNEASGNAFNNVLVRFYNGNPLAGGAQLGGNFAVNLPAGGSVQLTANDLPLGGAENVYVYVDANGQVAECDEGNNIAFVKATNSPPVAVAKNLVVPANGNNQGLASAEDFDGGSSDPDDDPITFSVAPAGPYPLGVTQIILTVSDGKGESDTDTATITVVDVTPPVVESMILTDTALKIGDTSLVTITFSEAISGFTNADLTIANGILSDLSSSDGGITWTGTLTPSASVTDTTNLITLDNAGITDLAGNAGTGTTDSNNYAIDTARPTAILAVADTELRIGETSPVTITFSEAVTGFDNTDLTVENGTLSNVASSDGGITWTATFTPTPDVSDFTNVITLTNAGVTDAAGNTGSGTADSNNYAVCTATVSVAKLSDGAETNTPTSGSFRLTQSAVSSVDTVVNFSTSGTATSVADYTVLAATATIPAGQTFVDVPVPVLNDNLIESTETVILTLDSLGGSNSGVNLAGSPNQMASLNITDNDIAASIAVDSGSGQSTTVNTTFANPLVVIVTDSGGVALQGAEVTFTAPGSGASGTFGSSATVMTNSAGLAMAPTFTANTIAGSYAVTATTPGVVPTASFSLTNTAGAATHFTVAAPGSAIAGEAVNVSVTAQDVFNNTDPSYTGIVQLGSTDGAAILPANSSLTSGVGTFSVNFSTGGNQTVTATDTVSSGITGTSAAVNVSPRADLATTISDSPDPVNALGNVTYAISMTNNGPSTAVSPSVSLPLPASTTFVSATAPAGWTGNTPAVGVNGTVSFSDVSLDSGVTVNFTVVAKVDLNVVNNSTLTATATAASSSTVDPAPGNNSSTTTTTAKSGADLIMTLAASPDPVVAGTELTYTIQVQNNGPLDADDVSIGDTLPAGTTFVSLSAPAGWSAVTPAVGAAGSVEMTNALFANGDNATFVLKVKVGSDVASGTLISNSAGVSSPVVDINPANNSALAGTTVTTQADLALAITRTPATAPKGSNVTYQITLTNHGPSDASAPNLSLPIPSQMTFVSAAMPGGWSSTQPAVGAGGTVSCSAGSLATGQSVAFTVVAKVESTATSGAVLTAIAAASSTATDPIAANNCAGAVIAVGSVEPTVNQPVITNLAVNPQTGLFEFNVNVTNTTPLPITGFRLHVNFDAYKAAYPSLRLNNATSPSKTTNAYIDYPYAMAMNETVSVKLAFYTSTRTFPSSFAPVLSVDLLSSGVVASILGSTQPVLTALPNKDMQLEFPTIAGRWYRVRYSSDLVHWTECPVPILASSNFYQWIDCGQPYTESAPAITPRRFYSVAEIAAP